MKRFFGMMPSNEVKIEKSYKDKNDLTVKLQAGPHGWTIIYADASSEFKDIDDISENNFKAAYDRTVEVLGELKEITSGGRLREASSSCEAVCEVD